MDVGTVIKQDDCRDRSQVYRLGTASPWDRSAIRRLGSLGELDYYADFPRPFYRLRGRAFWLKGVEGECEAELILLTDSADAAGAQLTQALEQLGAI
jgi:hypothetical protein